MSYAPDSIRAAQRYLHEQTGLPWAALGIVGDRAHDGGYHCGWDRRRRDRYGNLDDYSWEESSRDSGHRTDAASALDVGNWPGLQSFSRWLVSECARGSADTQDIREVIYSPDGRTVKRWDRLGRRSSGDGSHRFHTHISYFRDSERRDKLGLFRRYFEGGASPSVPGGGSTGTHRTGDSGPAVRELQADLNEALGLNLTLDGDYGPATTAAVRLLQQRAGITIDGIFGPDSARVLADLLEDDMRLDDDIQLTDWSREHYQRGRIDVETALGHGYVYSRAASDRARAALAGQATQTALLQQVLAAASGISEESITAAVAAGVREALPSVDELATAVAAAVDHDLDTAAVSAALREVLGSVDEAGE